MHVTSDSLARLTANALLYVNAKSLRTLGLSRFRVVGDKLSMLASDDYIAVYDTADITDNKEEVDFYLDKDALTKLEAYSRSNKKFDGDLNFSKDYDKLTFSVGEDSITVELPEFKESVFENYDLAEHFLFDEEDFPPTLTTVWALHPDRVAKLYRLKQQGEGAPIDMIFCETNGEPLVRFRYGLTILGIIAPIRREVVDDKFLWKNNIEV